MALDLRSWMEQVEKRGGLHHVTEPVHWDEEMAAITYLVNQRPGAPALLFESIVGYPGSRLLFNMLGTDPDRIAVALGVEPGPGIGDLISVIRTRIGRRIPPRVVAPSEATVFRHTVAGNAVDLTRFPAPKVWPLDGGRYIGTGDVVITRDPESGRLNVGTYRSMLLGPRQVCLYTSPGKDALLDRDQWWARGQACPVAIAYGIDPLLFIVGTQTFPKNVSEYEFAGGIVGEPVEVVPAMESDLLVPAHAEILVEGFARPGVTASEGPFGEFTGYYGRPEGAAPVIDIVRVHTRDDPIVTASLTADYPACDSALLFSLVRSARIWQDLLTLGIPGIHGVYAPAAASAGVGMTIVSVEQKHAGHAKQVATLAGQVPGGAYFTKWVIVVDEDVDPTDLHQVLWAMATRSHPATDIDILRNTWSTWLDPAQNPPENRPYGSKALIDACKEHRYRDAFARRSLLREEVYRRVVARWQALGLPGEPPRVRAFETAPPPREEPT